MKRQNWLAIVLAIGITLVIGATWYVHRLFPDAEIDTMIFYLANGAASSSQQSVALGFRMATPLMLVIFAFLLILVYRPRKKNALAKLHIKKLDFTLRFPHLRRRSRRERHIKVHNKSLHARLPIETIGKLSIAQVYALLLVVVFAVSAHSFGASTYVKRRYFENTNLYAEHYVHPRSVEVTFPEKKRNMVLIFVESLESTAASRANGGGWQYSIIPELEQYATDAVNFSATRGVGGAMRTASAENTTTGLVAQTSGTPLSIGNDINLNNVFNNYDNYLPGVVTMADMLAQHGYKQQFILGSDANFGNRKTYFTQHGNVDILDHPAAQQTGRIAADYKKWWGYEDKKLFQYAREEITTLAKSGQPFVQTLLTADTHFVDGYLDPSCKQPFRNRYENVYACSSAMISGYISWLQQQDFYDNTTVVILGDHLGMQTNFYTDNIPADYERTVFNAFINTPQQPTAAKQRIFTAYDIYPTLLASLGVDIAGDRLAFGTNLFSDQKTIAEMIGIDNFNTEVRKHSDYYQSCILGGACD